MKLRYYLTLGGAILLAHASFGQCVEPTDDAVADEIEDPIVQPIDYPDPAPTGTTYSVVEDDDPDLAALLMDLETSSVPTIDDLSETIQFDDGLPPSTEL